jgi:NADH dehydrogenase/NADH:ubiquinone oxidoreductase subunit G
MTPRPNEQTVARLTIDGAVREATPGERLIDVIERAGVVIPHVCYPR